MFYVRLTLDLQKGEQAELVGHANIMSDQFGFIEAKTVEYAAWSTLPFVAVIRGGENDSPYVRTVDAAPLPHTSERA